MSELKTVGCKYINGNIIVHHTAGFFSTCNIILLAIIRYYNYYNKFPNEIDMCNAFNWYKNDDEINIDISNQYFKICENNTFILNSQDINYQHTYQFKNYKKFIDYGNILPIIEHYFSPSNNILSTVEMLEKKYNIDYNNTCAVFFRGNDKCSETKLTLPEEYVKKIDNDILNTNDNIKLLIQSDQTEFIEYMTDYYKNSFYMKDEIRHMKFKKSGTVDFKYKKTNNEYSKYFLAIVIIMSKCKYVICGSGNISLWITFFRKNTNNFYQHLDNVWY